MHFRRLTLADIESFAELRHEAIAEHPESFGSPEEERGGPQKADAYRRWLGGCIIGAFDQDALIGTTGFYQDADTRGQHRGNLFTVYVLPPYRGRGIGDQLIKEIINHAKQHVTQVHLKVVTTAKAAIETYRRNGFEPYGTDPRVFRIGAIYFDEYMMVRRLDI